MKFISGALTIAVSALGACATVAVTPGMSRDEVLAHYGKPSAVLALQTGTRLQYSRQPEGRSAVMVDLDAADRVTAVREMLAPAGFATVELGQWTRADVERAFGPPAKMIRAYSWPGDIMTYRWRDLSQAMYFWVYLDDKQVVQRTGQGMEFPVRVFPAN